jgi:chromosome segregation ATPase
MTQVDQKDIETLRKRLLQTEREKAKLFGMNITAKMKPLGEASVKVCLSASGEEMTETDGQYDITEAVDITVPGVFSMSLTPKGIDLESVKAAIKEAEEIIKALYEKYHVSSLDELQNLSDTYQSSWKRTEDFERELQKIIGEKSWEDLEAENKNVPESIESVKEIDLQIRALCGLESVDRFIGKKEAILSEYEKKYGSMEELQKMMEFAKNEKNDSQKQLESLGKVPEKFAAIQNPETHDSLLQGRIADCEREMNQHNELLRTAERNLGEKSAEEYSEELQQKEAELEARKTEYQHWKNIYDVFLRLKEKTAANPTEDIEEKFREYLALISDGGLTLHSIDEKLSVKLASGNRELTYDILSDGTKDTIALAFRLAMLEHLYPDGDGLAVFDDPFTDMDPKRVEQSCKLVQKFAKNNQVIFITCDEKYRDFLEGNVLQVVK